MDLDEVCKALVATCADQSLWPDEMQGLTLYDVIPTSPEFPCLYPSWPSQLYEFSSRGSCNIDIALTVAVSRANELEAQPQLRKIVSSGLILEALYAAPREQWIDLAFINISNFRPEIFSDSMQALACDFNLSLRTK